MASIQTAIQLTDRMTAPINNIIGAVDNLCSAFSSVESGMNSAFDSAKVQEAQQCLLAAREQLLGMGREQDNYTEAVNRSNSAFGGLLGKIGAAVAAYASLQTVKNLMDMSDELTATTARLNMMNEQFSQMAIDAGRPAEELMSTPELLNMVYASAQDARGSFTDMAAVVARFGNNAKDAFGSAEEVVQFANLVQKQMTIAGASTAEASNAMLQLSQGLGSGVLRGDELNSIFEQAPNLIQSIADYMDVPIGQIRQMASEGQLTADIVKNAIFASADDINSAFEEMPMTWGQMWTRMGNEAQMHLRPLLNRLNEIANNQNFQLFASNAVSALAMVGIAFTNILEAASNTAAFISENWGMIAPVIGGITTALGLYTAALITHNTIQAVSNGIKLVAAAYTAMHTVAQGAETTATFAATAAQYGFNAALLACPITWIVIATIALVAAIVAFCAHLAKTSGVAQSTFGVIVGAVYATGAAMQNLLAVVGNVFVGIINGGMAVASNLLSAFGNAISGVQQFFYNLMSTALNVIASIASALNQLPFVEFDFSGITAKADEYAGKAAEAAGNKYQYTDVGAAFNDGMNTFQYKDVNAAFAAGASKGDGLSDKFKGMFSAPEVGGADFAWPDNVADAVASGIDASNAGGAASKAADALTATEEDLKYMRDIAERDAINRYTTAEITINNANTNNLSQGMGFDEMIDGMTAGLLEAVDSVTEGRHE